MSRLLFAAARGARIQTQYTYPKKKWATTPAYRRDDCYPYRIHPDDAHLQYGPISTALRDAAVESRQEALVYETPCGCTWGISMHEWYAFRDCDNELHRSLFLLILAEALADEGL